MLTIHLVASLQIQTEFWYGDHKNYRRIEIWCCNSNNDMQVLAEVKGKVPLSQAREENYCLDLFPYIHHQWGRYVISRVQGRTVNLIWGEEAGPSLLL